MRRLPWVFVFVTMLGSFLYAQTKRSPTDSAFIEIAGIKLRLGMTPREVTAKLPGTKITRIHGDLWGIGGEESPTETIQFTNGRLSFAQRYWKSFDNDIVESLFGAVSTLNQQGYSQCTVQTREKRTPDALVHAVWIVCGEKAVSITRDTIGDKSYNMVYEQLGDMRLLD